MRVLVGMTLADPDDQVLRALQNELEGADEDDGIDGEVARARRQAAVMNSEPNSCEASPARTTSEAFVVSAQHLVDGRVKIKLFTRRPLHGKTYLCHRQDANLPIVGFVGSSNLTMSGLRHNFELNVDVLDFDAAKKLDKWFEARWEDNFSIDITADLIELIDESWAGGASPHPSRGLPQGLLAPLS